MFEVGEYGTSTISDPAMVQQMGEAVLFTWGASEGVAVLKG